MEKDKEVKLSELTLIELLLLYQESYNHMDRRDASKEIITNAEHYLVSRELRKRILLIDFNS